MALTRIAHLADLHLGFRAYDRTGPGGINQREWDVQEALRRAVDDLLTQAPDLVLVAGDIFHSVRTPNAAIVFLYQQLSRIRTAFPATPIVLIAGDHDSPRSRETQSILGLYRTLGVTVVETAIERVRLPGLTVTAVPKAASAQLATCAPEPDVCNVLLAHGEARPDFAFGAHLDPAVLALPWDYVALGHYHVQQMVAPRVWYAGSLEYASTDVWGEACAGVDKGYLIVELGREVIRRPIVPPRRVLDLKSVDATGLGVAELNAALAARVESIDLADAVVRLVVHNVTRDLRHALDYRPIREWKARALHFQLDLRRAAEASTPAARAQRRQTLDQVVDAFLAGRALPPDLDRTALRQLGAAVLAAEPLDSLGTSVPFAPKEGT